MLSHSEYWSKTLTLASPETYPYDLGSDDQSVYRIMLQTQRGELLKSFITMDSNCSIHLYQLYNWFKFKYLHDPTDFI